MDLEGHSAQVWSGDLGRRWSGVWLLARSDRKEEETEQKTDLHDGRMVLRPQRLPDKLVRALRILGGSSQIGCGNQTVQVTRTVGEVPPGFASEFQNGQSGSGECQGSR